MDISMKRRYGTVSYQSEQERMEQIRKSQSKFVPTVELPEGWEYLKLPVDVPYVKIDILPFLTKTENGVFPVSHYDYYIHRNIGQSRTSVVCPNRQKGLPCPICERLRSMWNTPEGKELYSMQKIQRRTLYAVKWLDAPEKFKDKILIYDAAYYSFGRLIEEKIEARDISDPQEASWDKYCDPYEGSTIKINLTKGSWENRDFAKITAIEFKVREHQYTEDIYDEIPDLSKFVNILSLDRLNQLYSGDSGTQSDVENELPFDSRKSDFNLESGYHPLPTAEQREDVFVTNVSSNNESTDELRESIYSDVPVDTEDTHEDVDGITEEGRGAF